MNPKPHDVAIGGIVSLATASLSIGRAIADMAVRNLGLRREA